MKEFCYTDRDGDRFRFVDDGKDFIERDYFFAGEWKPSYAEPRQVDSQGIRALLSAHTEREKIFAEAIESFNEFADRIGGNDAVEAQIKSLAARWQATT